MCLTCGRVGGGTSGARPRAFLTPGSREFARRAFLCAAASLASSLACAPQRFLLRLPSMLSFRYVYVPGRAGDVAAVGLPSGEYRLRPSYTFYLHVTSSLYPAMRGDGPFSWARAGQRSGTSVRRWRARASALYSFTTVRASGWAGMERNGRLHCALPSLLHDRAAASGRRALGRGRWRTLHGPSALILGLFCGRGCGRAASVHMRVCAPLRTRWALVLLAADGARIPFSQLLAVGACGVRQHATSYSRENLLSVPLLFTW